MKIRTQLVLACFVLSVLPLSGIVLYSYHSSANAVESAYRQEAQRLTGNMDRRLATIRAELDERLASLSGIEIDTAPNGQSRATVIDSIVMAMGEAAPLIDALEFIPAPAAPTAAAYAPLSEAIVIDLPPVIMPAFEMSPRASAAMAEIGRLSADLQQNASKMTKEERETKRRQLREKSDLLEKEVETSRQKFQEQMKVAQAQLAARRKRQAEERQRRQNAPPAPAVAPRPVVAGAPSAIRPKSELSAAEVEAIETKARKTTLVLGRHFNVPVEQGGEVVGQIRAQLRPEAVIRRVLGGQAGDRDEIPFAVDNEGTIYTRNDAERSTLDRLGIPERIRAGLSFRDIPNWIVVATRDEESGLRVGVARPVGENFVELRQTAARNFGYGLGLIAFALIGIVPLANHFTRDVKRVTQGAERIAQGDLQTRIPVKGNDEFGQLALAFNKMAEDLSDHQRRLFAEERARREQAVHQRVLAVEYERKSSDLEDARRFQLSMLPKELPRHEAFDVAVFTQTATEVGGDYYDFHDGQDGLLSVTIGDATGHGARAGTMVTVIKTLFAGYDGRQTPAQFLSDAAGKIKRMELGRMAMALSLARFERGRLTVATAGMPPLLRHRAATGEVEEIALPATPLGTIEIDYAEQSVALDAGDTVLLMSDGFPELLDMNGQQLGYPGAMEEFARSAAASPDANGVIEALAAAARRWHGGNPPNDDITFVVVRMRG
ncbi:MAG TPA: SpoIIE family protein phosphatase [Thermoanaerobaculia bacterium]|nr:SpoIIE family protein phosphatase [Thermoanaerobaculia bacterium]